MACCRYRNIRCNCKRTRGYTSSPNGAYGSSYCTSSSMIVIPCFSRKRWVCTQCLYGPRRWTSTNSSGGFQRCISLCQENGVPKRCNRYSMQVPSLRWMGCGVTISNPSSGGVIRCRLDASAKKAKTWSRASGRRIEVVSVCIIGSVTFLRSMLQEMVWFYDPCALTLSAKVPGRWHHGKTSAVSLPCSRMLWLALHSPCRVLEHNPIPIEILERLPLGFPIRVIRWDTLEPRCEHPGTTG